MVFGERAIAFGERAVASYSSFVVLSIPIALECKQGFFTLIAAAQHLYTVGVSNQLLNIVQNLINVIFDLLP